MKLNVIELFLRTQKLLSKWDFTNPKKCAKTVLKILPLNNRKKMLRAKKSEHKRWLHCSNYSKNFDELKKSDGDVYLDVRAVLIEMV